MSYLRRALDPQPRPHRSSPSSRSRAAPRRSRSQPGGGGPTPPPEPLDQAIHDALAAPTPDGVTARVKFTNNLFPSGALLGQTGSALMSGASGRLWLTNDGRGRIELQSDAGDVQIVWNPSSVTVYDASSNTVYQADLPADDETSRRRPARPRRRSPTSTRCSTELGVHWALSDAQPTDVAGQPAYSVSVSPKHDGGLLGSRRARLGRRARRAAARRRSTRRAAPRPVLALAVTDISYGAVPAERRRRRAARRREGRRPRLRRRPTTARARRRVTGLDAVRPRADFPVVAPDSLVGLPRRDVRLVGGDTRARRSTARASAGSSLVERKADASGARQRSSSGLPTVSLDGLTAHELATQLGTVLEWQRGGTSFVLAGLAAGRGRRGGRPGREVSDALPVEARGLVKRYGEIVAVDHVDLTVERGDVFGYLGPNGAGKTTSLRMLLGLIRPTAGSARLFGRDPLVAGREGARRRRRLRRGAALLPVPVAAGATCELLADYDEPVSRGAHRRGARARRAARPGEGPRRRLLARDAAAARDRGALLRRPRLLLLDEPTTGLDPAGMRDMRDLVRRLAGEGITILLSSHLLNEVEELCNRVAIIRKGSIVYEGALRDLLATAASGYRLRAARARARARRAPRPARASTASSCATASCASPATTRRSRRSPSRSARRGSRSPRSCRRRRASRSSSSA